MIEHATLNQSIPDFTITTTGNFTGKISDYGKKHLVLFFYPKDNTPVCTAETKAFRDHIQAFNDLNTLVFGVSRDSITSHERFKTRLALPFELIADTKSELCDYFDVIAMKNFFGKKFKGIVRSTFLIDQNRVLIHTWRNVKVSGHLEEVIEAISCLKDGS